MAKKKQEPSKLELRKKILYQAGVDYRNLGLMWEEIEKDDHTSWELEVIWSGYADQDKIIREAWDNNEGF